MNTGMRHLDWEKSYIAKLKLERGSAFFHSINRNKQCLAADLKNLDHLAQVNKLISRADEVLQNIRSGLKGFIGLDNDKVRFKSSSASHAVSSTRRKLRKNSSFDR